MLIKISVSLWVSQLFEHPSLVCVSHQVWFKRKESCINSQWRKRNSKKDLGVFKKRDSPEACSFWLLIMKREKPGNPKEAADPIYLSFNKQNAISFESIETLKSPCLPTLSKGLWKGLHGRCLKIIYLWRNLDLSQTKWQARDGVELLVSQGAIRKNIRRWKEKEKAAGFWRTSNPNKWGNVRCALVKQLQAQLGCVGTRSCFHLCTQRRKSTSFSQWCVSINAPRVDYSSP